MYFAMFGLQIRRNRVYSPVGHMNSSIRLKHVVISVSTRIVTLSCGRVALIGLGVFPASDGAGLVE